MVKVMDSKNSSFGLFWRKITKIKFLVRLKAIVGQFDRKPFSCVIRKLKCIYGICCEHCLLYTTEALLYFTLTFFKLVII